MVVGSRDIDQPGLRPIREMDGYLVPLIAVLFPKVEVRENVGLDEKRPPEANRGGRFDQGDDPPGIVGNAAVVV